MARKQIDPSRKSRPDLDDQLGSDLIGTIVQIAFGVLALSLIVWGIVEVWQRILT